MQKRELRAVPRSPTDMSGGVSPISAFLNGVPGNERTRSQVLKDLARINAAQEFQEAVKKVRVAEEEKKEAKEVAPAQTELKRPAPQAKRGVLAPRSINVVAHSAAGAVRDAQQQQQQQPLLMLGKTKKMVHPAVLMQGDSQNVHVNKLRAHHSSSSNGSA